MAEYIVKPGRRTRPPVHPGRLLKTSVFPELGLSMTRAADILGISRQMLHKITREDNPDTITPEMAVKIGALCGNGTDIWINMQRNYDVWYANRKVDVSSIVKARKELVKPRAAAGVQTLP